MVEAATRPCHMIALRLARARAAPLGRFKGPAAQRSDQFARRTISSAYGDPWSCDWGGSRRQPPSRSRALASSVTLSSRRRKRLPSGPPKPFEPDLFGGVVLPDRSRSRTRALRFDAATSWRSTPPKRRAGDPAAASVKYRRPPSAITTRRSGAPGTRRLSGSRKSRNSFPTRRSNARSTCTTAPTKATPISSSRSRRAIANSSRLRAENRRLLRCMRLTPLTAGSKRDPGSD